jgi:hypothetical protein
MLSLWVLVGAIHTGDKWWVVRWSFEKLMKSRGSLPVLDGLAGSIMQGEPTKVMKGVVVASVVVAAVLLACWSARARSGEGVAVCLGLLGMAIILNRYEIWAVVRFGKLLVLPLAVAQSPAPLLEGPHRRWVVLVALVAGLTTNIAYAYYLTRLYLP